jgi:hypothetical protein
MGRFLIAIEVFDKKYNSVGIFSIEIQAENKEAARKILFRHNPGDMVDALKFGNLQITDLSPKEVSDGI